MSVTELLPASLVAAVPLALADLARRGGPSDSDRDDMHSFSQVLAEHGDALLYRVTTPAACAGGYSSAQMFTRLVRALAVLAYVPGGITLFGEHWEVTE